MLDLVYKRNVNGELWSCAYDLHKQLGVKQVYDTWVSKMIEVCDLRENIDYLRTDGKILLCTNNVDVIGNKMRIFILNCDSEDKEIQFEEYPETFEMESKSRKYDWWLYEHFFGYEFPEFPKDIIKELSYIQMQDFIEDYVTSNEDVRKGMYLCITYLRDYSTYMLVTGRIKRVRSRDGKKDMYKPVITKRG